MESTEKEKELHLDKIQVVIKDAANPEEITEVREEFYEDVKEEEVFEEINLYLLKT